jgi:hypothetical protein
MSAVNDVNHVNDVHRPCPAAGGRWFVSIRANQRRLVLGLERFPKDLGGLDPSRGLIFLTLPLMLRRRFVEAPAARGSLLVSLRAKPRASPRVFLVLRKTLGPLSSGS